MVIPGTCDHDMTVKRDVKEHLKKIEKIFEEVQLKAEKWQGV